MVNRRNPHFRGAMWAGLAAGIVNGLFGGGGGLLLIPGLRQFARVEEASLFPISVCVMLPVCLLSLFLTALHTPLPWSDAAPYLAGSIVGGILVGAFGKRIPTRWLHRALGLTLIWGGIRYLL